MVGSAKKNEVVVSVYVGVLGIVACSAGRPTTNVCLLPDDRRSGISDFQYKIVLT